MRVIIQKVKRSQVRVDGEIVGKIDRGLNLLVGITHTDTPEILEWMAQKCVSLRVFDNSSSDRWDQSVVDIQGGLLVISQFTLYGDCRKGRRPSFDQAAPPQTAQLLYDRFVEMLRRHNLQVETGIFGAQMEVLIENDGPVTLILEKEAASPG